MMNRSINLEDIALVSALKFSCIFPNISYNQSEIKTIEQTLFSTISRTEIRQLTDDPGTPANTTWIAIKSATIHPRLSQEPHDIIKELRVLSSISHANVRPFIPSP
jgi:hypothetical protein